MKTNQNRIENKKSWYRENAPLGKRLGYPQCCIDEFCQQTPEFLKTHKASVKDFARYQAGHLNGKFTGFIPCYRHAVLIMYKTIKLQDLIKNRDPQFPPFPLHEILKL